MKTSALENSVATDAATTSSTRLANKTTRVRIAPETRAQMLERLTNPTISLHETSVILDVCSATVRRYCKLEMLPHSRTQGGQRRFRLRDVLALARAQDTKKRQRR